MSQGVKDKKAFLSMILDTDEVQYPAQLEQLQITGAEYEQWRREIAAVDVDAAVMESVLYIREQLQNMTDKESGAVYSIYVSDRRWKKAVNLLRASAFVHGRRQTNLSDVAVLAYCLWNEPAECAVVREVVTNSLFAALDKRHVQLQQRVEKAVRMKRAAAALEETRMQARPEDVNLILYDDFYYRLSTYNTGNTYIFASDYHRLPSITERNPVSGHLYTDATDPAKERIRAFGNNTNYNSGEKVRLMRDREFLYINGVRCELERYSAREMAALQNRQASLFTADGYDYEAEIEQCAAGLNGINSCLADNIFINPADAERMRSVASEMMKRIALTRADISELLYG
jgi:MoxR-like ATPase